LRCQASLNPSVIARRLRSTTPVPTHAPAPIEQADRSLQRMSAMATGDVERGTQSIPPEPPPLFRKKQEIAAETALRGSPPPVSGNSKDNDQSATANTNPTLNNIVVVVASELLALPFCFNGADGIMSGDWSKGFKGFGVGLPIALAGLTFPLWRTRLRPATQRWIRTDAMRWMLPAAFLALFLFVLGPDIYRRATIVEPPQTGVVSQADYDAVSAKLVAANDEIKSREEQRIKIEQVIISLQKQVADLQAKLVAHEKELASHAFTSPPIPEDQTPINWQPEFNVNYNGEKRIIWIRFAGQATSLAHIKDAYIVSNLTGHSVHLKVFDDARRWDITGIEPVAPGAVIELICDLSPPLPVTDFLEQWGTFEFHVIYDGDKEHKQSFDQYAVEQYLTKMHLFGPHVTPKNE
jgi:hypothetical protein